MDDKLKKLLFEYRTAVRFVCHHEEGGTVEPWDRQREADALAAIHAHVAKLQSKVFAQCANIARNQMVLVPRDNYDRMQHSTACSIDRKIKKAAQQFRSEGAKHG